MADKDFWNERFGQEEYIYGENPNAFLEAQLNEVSEKGKILFPAEGEGRNAVFAATLGWNTFAFDQSEAGKEKAEKLAKKQNVSIDYQITDLEKINYESESFDAVSLIYAHFPPQKRKEYHQKLATYLKKGGLLILEGFSKNHVENQQKNPNAGGPRNVDMLFSLEELKNDFENFNFKELVEAETELKEGNHHLGHANVIRLVATKK